MCIAPHRRPATSSLGPAASLQSQLAVKADFTVAQNKNLSAAYPKAAAPSSQRRKASRSERHHITVQHNYHDHSKDVCCESRRLPARGGVVTPFPLKLHSMLEAVQSEGLEHIVSWQPHGRCFVVHDAKKFVAILEQHFKISKVSSFQRQLNLYGFQRLTKGQDKGGYYHELFLRGKIFLSQNIQRIKVKGTKIRARSNPDQEPNFYSMPWVMDGSEDKNETVNHDYFTSPMISSSTIVSPPASVSSDEQPMQDALDSLIDISPELWEVLPEGTPLEKVSTCFWDDNTADPLSVSGDDAVEAFLEDFDFPSDAEAFKNIEDDNVFGELLEQMIAS
ncbi:unnamed protein product [Cylindrotheca closterium]|uniref:HSF-type DNA-binding domain-containing protein n=1 Tax=Cylindrotheca closterium TaxID=2856 RepID=A0AAD2FYQ2_9STRA|nr:unnamed protein product [Cylindrotheca closterium]